MKIYYIDKDLVIDAKIVVDYITYSEAITKLIPLISKTEFQKKLQDKKF